MLVEELSDLMHEASPGRGASPDLHRIRRLGRRRRWAHRAATGATVATTVVALAGVWMVLGPGGDSVTVRSAGQDHEKTSVTSYERSVLADVPGSYLVDGTVVLPDVAAPGSDSYGAIVPRRIVGTPVELGFHGTVGPGYLASRHTEAAYQDNAPKGSQVLIDPGPLWIGCAKMFRGAAACEPTVLVKDMDGRFVFLYGFGTEDFLKPGAEMELFTDDDYSDRKWSRTLIGGFHGAETARVLVELTDGSQVEAQLDVDEMSPGNTLFWAKLPREIAVVRAYDAHGELLEEHALRACTDPTDCEVR